MTTRRARTSLAGAFQPEAAPMRAQALQRLLPPRRAAEEPAPTGAASDIDTGSGDRPARDGDRPAPSTSDESSRRGVVADRSSGTAADVVRSVAVYLPMEVLERLRATAHSRQLTYADLLVEAAATHLSDVTPSFRRRPRIVDNGGMPGRPSRRVVDPAVQVQLRLDGHQVAWLDTQATELGAASRTALVVALLRRHLGLSDGPSAD